MTAGAESLATGGLTDTDTMSTHGYVDSGEEFTPKFTVQNRFYDAEQFVNQRRNDVALIAISYRQKSSNEIINICASPGNTTFVYTDEFNMSQRTRSRDFLINTSDLVINGSIVLPQDGDIIIEDNVNKKFTFEVGAWNGEPHFRYAGIYRQTLRVHTKLIDTEE